MLEKNEQSQFMTNLPKIAQCGPISVELEANQLYSWCTCGLSADQPFCDGAHKGTEFRSLKHTPDTSGTVYLCACKHTKTPPYCDGTHSTLDRSCP